MYFVIKIFQACLSWLTEALRSKITSEKIGAKLNIPPFLDGCQQLQPEDISTGRRIASLRIHVERVIGRVKNYSILKGVLPLSMSRIANQIVYVCAFLANSSPFSTSPTP